MWDRKTLLGVATLGTLVRLAPLLDIGGRLLRQWPTEDGYLTLTIARNIAAGRGFSVAGGEVLTNGTQPLATLAYAGAFAACGLDVDSSIRLILVLQTLAALLAGLLLYRFTAEWLGKESFGRAAAVLAFGVWYLHPIVLPHTVNCLETSFVLAIEGLVLWFWWRDFCQSSESPRSPLIKQAGRLGLLLGLMAWGRVDSVLFMISLGLSHLWLGWRRERLRSALVEGMSMAALAGPAIFPWLLYGKRTFGYWVPISGIAEGHFAKMGQNLPLLPAKLFEYTFALVGVPGPLEEHWLLVLVCTLALIGWAIAVWHRARHQESGLQAPLVLGALIVALYGTYYGACFGAPHFLSRYLAPMTLISIPASAALLCRPMLSWGSGVRGAAVVVAGGLLLAQQVRLYQRGPQHLHRQVVEWTLRNVPEDVWIGAVQTGTLGFFHERTLNLDGKVDPRALRAKLSGKHEEYIAASKIQAMVDWAGTVAFMGRPTISAAFRARLVDRKRNLAVLVRRGGPLDAEEPAASERAATPR